MTMEMILDFMGMRLDGPKAEGKVITMNWSLPDELPPSFSPGK
jgi:alkyl sulfatase BDS1-like metallo-beta-lactamase superfamily hydrolase